MSGQNPPPGGGADDAPEFEVRPSREELRRSRDEVRRPHGGDDAESTRSGWRKNRVPGRHRQNRGSSRPPQPPEDDPPGESGSDTSRKRGIPPVPGEFAGASSATTSGEFPRPRGGFGSDTGGFGAVPGRHDTGGFGAVPGRHDTGGFAAASDGSSGGARPGSGGSPPPTDSDELDPYKTDGVVPDPYAEQAVERSAYDLLPDQLGPVSNRPVPLPRESAPTFWTGLLVGVFTLCVLAAVAVYYFFGAYAKPPERRIVRPPVAGGLKLDTEAASVYSRLLDPYRQVLQDISRNRIGAANAVTAVYDAGLDPETGQRRQILFVGSTGDLGNPRTLASDFRDLEKKRKNLKVIRVNPGEAGGEAFCLELRIEQAVGNTAAGCVWLTENSVGYIIPTSPARAADVANTMRKMRPDLEKIEQE
jgi:hypothetical protein